MNFLKQLISDGEMPSTTRVLALVVVVPIMIVWTVLCIRQGQFIIPDTKIILLVATAVGGKTLQSFAENLKPQPSPPGPAK